MTKEDAYEERTRRYPILAYQSMKITLEQAYELATA
jgi:hypothetical protein